MEFVQQNFLLIAVAVVSGLMLIWPLLRGGGKRLEPQEAVLKMNREDALVLDVREAAEFAQGHIPGARHIPLGELARRIGELEKFKGKPIVVACRSGHRSAGACGILEKNGFENVYNLAGGMIAWEAANLPVEK